jgi:sodium/potassium-transporting ATPase subunit alpha
MTVTRVSILDDDFTTMEARESLATSNARGSNVLQLAAIAGICNGAEFLPEEMDHPPEIRGVNGDATDAAILRFAELMTPVNKVSKPWTEVFRVNFNSKTKFSESRCPSHPKPPYNR